jgi:hypothetical protein
MNTHENAGPMKSRWGTSFHTAFAAALILGLGLTGCDKATTTNSSQSLSPTPATDSSPGSRKYTYGTKLTFDAAGNAGPFKLGGWNAAETEGTWTEGNIASLAFTIPPSDGQIIFKATLSGFVKPPELASQPVDVLLNGKPVAHWELAVKGLVQMAIPPEYVRDGELRIDFKLPRAASPKSLGVSVDERLLGICFYDLELVKP